MLVVFHETPHKAAGRNVRRGASEPANGIFFQRAGGEKLDACTQDATRLLILTVLKPGDILVHRIVQLRISPRKCAEPLASGAPCIVNVLHNSNGGVS